MPKILIIEDERELARGLSDILEYEGYEVSTVGTAKAGLDGVSREEPDCVILDIMLPDMSGYQVCEELRRRNRRTPILMLTAKAQDYDKIRGLEVGADDYMTKPFSVGELIARVKALLRRSQQYTPEPDTIRIGNAAVDVRHFTVRRGRKEQPLSHYEVELIKLLFSNANQPVGRDEILQRIWGTEAYPTNRTVDNFIVKLRKKIEDDYRNPRHILTIYGVGYKLSP
jgi:DNA-binding response OmpR family regulator